MLHAVGSTCCRHQSNTRSAACQGVFGEISRESEHVAPDDFRPITEIAMRMRKAINMESLRITRESPLL